MTARIVIAASRSGEGKTTLAVGLARALRDRGLRVACAKVGPDYLDTGWHSVATGADARNLDIWMMGEVGVRGAFSAVAASADVVVIEGVMGLYDGHRLDPDATSTAAVATLLAAPVLVALDASRSATTLAAVASGLASYRQDVRVGGAVLNRFREGRERSAIARAFDSIGVPVMGWMPTDPEAAIGSRHLGLVQAHERADAEEMVAAAAELVERSVDLDAVLALARSAPALAQPDRERTRAVDVSTLPRTADAATAPVIAVARDAAFAFYYPDNVEALERAGARIVEFSPLADAAIPAGTAGIYLGGGYPELHAEALSRNESMRHSIAHAAESGVPVFAECGGMLYLFDSLSDADGVEHPMAGVLTATAVMTDSLKRVGYVEATVAADCALGAAGTRVRGHEFRYSECMPPHGAPSAFYVDGEPHGFRAGSVVASYLHLNFAGCPQVADAFVGACMTHARAADGGIDE